MNEIMQKLQEPFEPSEIEWRVGATTQAKDKGLALAYVTNRAIQNRLDDVFGCFGWKNEYREWHGDSQLCGISIKVGDEWITKWDGADDSATEATKGGLSDAMKRAAYQWGIGRYLYKLPQVWVPIKPVGKSYVITSKPDLPIWALPKGYNTDSRKAESVPVSQPKTTEKTDTLTDEQLEFFKNALAQEEDQESAKERLKNLYKGLKVNRLSEVKQRDFETLKNKFLEYGLPFDLGGTND